MIEQLRELEILTPVFTLIGILIGAFLSFLTTWLLKSKETKLKISGQLIEKRIEAHEKILELSKSMRATVSLDKTNTEGEYITHPIIFSTKKTYQDWRSSFFLIANKYSHWLGKEVTKELYFIQDYVTNLDKRLDKAHDNNYMLIGIILNNDFVNMAANIEKNVLNFFDTGWRSLRIEQKRGEHKYPKKITLKRLHELNLFKRHLELHKYLEKEKSVIPNNDIKSYTELYNIAPNGLKVDIITLKEVPNVDNSSVEYEMSFNENEDYGKPVTFGHCELIGGRIMFDKVEREAKTLGVDFKAIKLLVNWIEENIEEIEFDSQTIEYE